MNEQSACGCVAQRNIWAGSQAGHYRKRLQTVVGGTISLFPFSIIVTLVL